MERTRDLARTRERILKAALAEFAAHGLAGTRCDDIARRARVNKRMLFYCFGCKEELYREILRRKFSERATLYESVPGDLGRAILHWYEAFSSDLEWVRLLEWEALGNGRGELVGEQERRQYLKRTLDGLRRAQRQGLLPKGLHLTQLQISIIALTAFPLAFPQMTRLASGMAPTDSRFRRQRLEFLRWLGERLSSASPRQYSPRVSRRKTGANDAAEVAAKLAAAPRMAK
ncbi:MAG: TetR/AcrR family transcriptional regulator [Deltaproteobacteria bacterium]|nr:TetR/AcrR family transcriptional regulator [Deltaproteobacteria bacterium]